MDLTLKTLMTESENNKELFQFLTEHKITNTIVETNKQLFGDYLTSYQLCRKNEKREKCHQPIPGYRYRLVFKNNQIQLVLTDCPHRINNLRQSRATNNFLIRGYDEQLLSLSLSKHFIANNPARIKIINYLKANNYKIKAKKGLYLYGDTGVGKTFIFTLIANKLIEKDNTVCFVSWPEFIIDIKKGFKNENENIKKIEQLKTCDFLFIDDLGSESVSSWSRDELLFPVLNARLLPLKTTFINSSYNWKFLADRYLTQRHHRTEEMQVKRLIQRIKSLTDELHLTTFNPQVDDEQNTNQTLATNQSN